MTANNGTSSSKPVQEQSDVFTTAAKWIVLPLLIIGGMATATLLSMVFTTQQLMLLFVGGWIVAIGFFAAIFLGVLPPLFACWEPPAKRARDCARTRFGLAGDMAKEEFDWLLVGSGIGGLTCAAILSQLGYKVCVLEAHEIAGGSTHEYELKGYTFPSGLHYVIPHCQQVLQLTCGSKEPTVEFKRLGNEAGFYERIRLTRCEDLDDLLIKDESQLRAELHKRYPGLKTQLERYESVATSVLAMSPLWMALHVMNWKFRAPLMKLLLPQVWWDYAGRTAQDVITELFADAPESEAENVHQLLTYLCALWVDTGCPPHRASFFMSVAVALGFPHEGGVYPEGGTQEIAKTLTERIEAAGGRVLTRAPVQEILVKDGKAAGVKMGSICKSVELYAKQGVITACGWRNTRRLLGSNDAFPEASQLQVPQGDGFVMANIGIKGKDLDLQCCNMWPLPGGDGQSIFEGIAKYLEDPLGVPPKEIPVMITFPSVKDRKHTGDKQTAQILALAKTEWFGAVNSDETADDRQPTWKPPERTEEYEKTKEIWKNRLQEAFLSYYPQLEGKIELFDVSTPMTIEHYLPTGSGSAIGLDVTAGESSRFTSFETMKLLDMQTPIENLWMTGQDTLLIGVPLAQAAGLMTALRIAGPLTSIQFILKSVWLLLYDFGQRYRANQESTNLRVKKVA